jgi:hypothetical protein
MTHNTSIERTCPGKPGHAAHVERYTCACSDFAPHRMSSEWSQFPRLAFLATLWRSPWALRALALHRSLFEAAAPLVNVVTRAFALPVREAVGAL